MEALEGMTVGEPVAENDIPDRSGGPASKYTQLFSKVDQLDEGQWLPVTVENQRCGQRLIEIAKMRGYRRKRRGMVVYIARKEGETDGTQS